MIRLLESADPYTTPFLPASHKWETATNVTVEVDAGRSGFTGDNALGFDASLGSLLERPISLTSVLGIYTATLGQALQVLTVGVNDITLASIRTALYQFNLILDVFGAIRVDQVAGGVPIGTICESAEGVVPVGSGGTYVELQLVFQLGSDLACVIRVADQYGVMNGVAAGALLALVAGEVPSTLRLGGGTGETGTWLVDDVYLTDGVPAATPQLYQGRLLFNDSFLGNTHVEAFYPTSDGTNLSTDNVPWVPNAGVVQYTQIDEHPPDEDVTYITADQSEQTSTFVFQSPHAQPFGLLNCEAFAAIYGIQWDARARNAGVSATIASIVRQIVGGTIPTDLIAEGAMQDVDLETYQYFLEVFNRNPITGQPWTFAVFFPAFVGAPGTTEFGVRLL